MNTPVPHDVFVTVIRDYTFDKDTLRSLSLVSRSFCEIAQRVLFRKVNIFHETKLTYGNIRENGDVLPPFKWKKLEFLARSPRILGYIRLLIVLITYDDLHPVQVYDAYWQEAGGRAILNTLDQWLPPALERMASLEILAYSGPPIQAAIHQAILRNKTIRRLRVNVATHCSVPCKEALQKPDSGGINDLGFEEIGNEREVFGFKPFSIGPRRCAFLSHMILTHSSSLRTITVPMSLLYDALMPSRDFPEFPHLSSLLIEDSKFSNALREKRPAWSAAVLPFIVHTHSTIKTLQWGRDMVEDMTKQVRGTQFPNLETFSGYGIRHLIQTCSPRRLRIVTLCPDDFDSDSDWSLLRETSSRLLDLSVLSISTSLRSILIPLDACTFSSITELWYEELPDCMIDEDPYKTNDGRFPLDFIHTVLPALHKLQLLCLTLKGRKELKLSVFEGYGKIKLLSSPSLCQLTVQLLFYSNKTLYRFDAQRKDPQSDWVYTSSHGIENLLDFVL
ncbi:hypothetical protein FRC16_005649 [Serendipita sp. 398]|nr:hypothetical protein FRC16_005649 [Serendipita sp. 398]